MGQVRIIFINSNFIFFFHLFNRVKAVIHCSLETPTDEKADNAQYSIRDTHGRLAPSMTDSSPKET